MGAAEADSPLDTASHGRRTADAGPAVGAGTDRASLSGDGPGRGVASAGQPRRAFRAGRTARSIERSSTAVASENARETVSSAGLDDAHDAAGTLSTGPLGSPRWKRGQT